MATPKEIAVRQQTAVQPAEPQTFAQLFIDRAMELAQNTSVDLERLRVVLDMGNQFQEMENEKAFYQALAMAQQDMAVVKMDKYNKHTGSWYSSEAALLKAVRDAITPYGLAWSMEPKTDEKGNIYVVGTLTHKMGHFKKYESIRIPPDSAGSAGKTNKTAIQAAASSTTYCRKELTEAVFAVAQVLADNDGNKIEDTLSEDQVANIEALLTENNQDKKALLDWLEVDSLQQVPVNQYNNIVRLLQADAEKARQAKARGK
jgi:hypothetical protein